jgi:hypothetical protein
MILYIKNPQNSTPKFLDIINSFINVTRHKINLQKEVAILYAKNKQTEKEYWKTIPVTMASKKSNT